MPSPNTVAQKNPFDAAPHADGLTQSPLFIAVAPLNPNFPHGRENRFGFQAPLRLRKNPLIAC
jgi:hypothetical protein